VGAGGFTVTVTDFFTVVLPLVAVSVYVVVTAGLTDFDVPVTVPIPLSILNELALPVIVQDNVVELPDIIVEGFAVKLLIVRFAAKATGVEN